MNTIVVQDAGKIYSLFLCLQRQQYRGFKNWSARLYFIAIGITSVFFFFMTAVSLRVESVLPSVAIRSLVVGSVAFLTIFHAMHYAYGKKTDRHFFILLPLPAIQLHITRVLADVLSPRNGLILCMGIALCRHFASTWMIFVLSLGCYAFIHVCVSVWLTNIFELFDLLYVNMRDIVRLSLFILLFGFIILVLVLKVDPDQLLAENVMSLSLPISMLEGLLASSPGSGISYLPDTIFFMVALIAGLVVGRYITRISLRAQ